MKRYDLVIIGAGPAGLAASIEAAKRGAKVLIVDENDLPGGQLFKQIHKFFGSHEHGAGVRGFRLAAQFVEEAKALGVEFMLSAKAWGSFTEGRITVTRDNQTTVVVGKRVLVASGANENAFAFENWNMTGVMTAGAVQTFINIHRVLPAKRVLMLGSGNVGLIVSYQLMQAGAEIAGIVEAAPKIGGYFVHAAKLRRFGVPFYMQHTIVRAEGEDDRLQRVVLAAVDERFKPIDGTEFSVEADAVCLAVGMTPSVEFARTLGCKLNFVGTLGGAIPVHDHNMRTSNPLVYIAGDVSGIEEASTAIEEGRIAGCAIAGDLGLIGREEADAEVAAGWHRLEQIRMGYHGLRIRNAKEELMKQLEVAR
ncbi:MAG: NAD(P)/FAD-dependent oxidoreductase [Clostridia bacterium]|nr:NAD(P)/FAD-dependent oxidoreductase [Clostridia bacterium]